MTYKCSCAVIMRSLALPFECRGVIYLAALAAYRDIKRLSARRKMIRSGSLSAQFRVSRAPERAPARRRKELTSAFGKQIGRRAPAAPPAWLATGASGHAPAPASDPVSLFLQVMNPPSFVLFDATRKAD